MSDAALLCANHPNRETTLRCNRCEKPICSKCAVLTPVGYRCKECVRGQQAIFDTAGWTQAILGGLVAALGVGLGIGLLRFVGFFGLLVAPVLGGLIAEGVRAVARRSRGRRLERSVLLGGVFGVAPFVLLPIFAVLLAGDARLLLSLGFEFLFPIAYGVLMIGAMYARIRGIRL
jgi:hypothetical protein